MATFNKLSDFESLADYKQNLVTATSKVGNLEVKFAFFEKYKFKDGTGPLLLVDYGSGVVDAAKHGGTLSVKGVCSLSGQKLAFKCDSGEIDHNKIVEALKKAGAKRTAHLPEDEPLETAATVGVKPPDSPPITPFTSGKLSPELSPKTSEPSSAAVRRTSFLKKYPNAAKLLNGIEDSMPESAKLATLKDNFVNSGFTYSMTSEPETNFVNGPRIGDCGTLAKAYVMIATEALGIKVALGYEGHEFFVEGGGEVTNTNKLTGNVDNGAHWAFTNHHWVVTPSGTYDLLFKGNPVKKAWVLKSGDGITTLPDSSTVTYREFGKFKVYAARSGGPIAERYATTAEAAKIGSVKAEEGFSKSVKEMKRNTTMASLRSHLIRSDCPSELVPKIAEVLFASKVDEDGKVEWEDKELCSMEEEPEKWSREKWEALLH